VRQRSFAFSALLHALLLLMSIFGLPLLASPPPVEPAAITVELLPITGITNVKPSEEPPAPEEKPAPEKEQSKPSPPVKTEKETPPPPPAEKPAEKPEVKKPEPKKEEKKPKEEDLEAVLKAVRETAQKKKDEKKDDKKDGGSKNKSISNKYDPSMPLSLSEMDAIMGQIAKCWNVPAGAKNAQDLIIVVYAEFNVDGSYVKVELAQDQRRYGSDTFFRAAADAAIRAVKQCSPLTGLPADKFQKWRALELHFDPRFMLN
jgi:type IV secretory pathway VirB10-like protein